MADIVHAEQKNDNTGAGFGGNYNADFNPYTTGTLEINDVTPLDGEGGPVGKPGRTTAETANISQQESISRELASSPEQIEARAAADTSQPEER